MFQRCELTFSVANIAILRKPENVARIFQGSFIKKACNLAEINNNNNNNLECCRAYRCRSAFNELGVFHLVYCACHACKSKYIR